MFNKSIIAALGAVILPVLFSMIGDQDGFTPAQAVPKPPAAISGFVQGTPADAPKWSVSGSQGLLARSPFFAESSKRNSEEKKIKEAAKALRQAETDQDRADAKATLADLLGADYDSRLADYEAHLEKLEDQLSEMRGKLAKRRDAKSKMIELRIQVLEAEADDLGWPTRMNSRSGFFPSRTIGISGGATGFSSLPAVVAPTAKPTQPAQPTQPKRFGR